MHRHRHTDHGTSVTIGRIFTLCAMRPGEVTGEVLNNGIISDSVTGRLKMREMNLRHQFARVEIAGHENAGPICRGGKCGKS